MSKSKSNNENETLYDALFELINQGLVIIDIDMNIVFSNLREVFENTEKNQIFLDIFRLDHLTDGEKIENAINMEKIRE